MSTNVPFHIVERWKPIAGFEGIYWISNYGRIKSKWIGLLKPQANHLRGNYLSVSLYYGNGKCRRRLIHLLVMEAFGTPKPISEERIECNHQDGIKSNCRIDNLEWCTPKYNQQHAVRLRLIKPCKGDNHRNSKLSEAQRAEVIVQRLLGCSQRAVAKMFGVTPTTIWQILHKNREGYGYV